VIGQPRFRDCEPSQVIDRARAGHARQAPQLNASCERLNRFASFRIGANGFVHGPSSLRAGGHGNHASEAAPDIGGSMRRGPSMYEMEGPRLCPGALATRLLRGRTPRSYHQCQILAVSTGRPALPASPPVSLGLEPVFCGEEFLLATAPAAQGLSAISSRFFCRPQDICRLSPVHSSFPLAYAQVCPQSVWTDRPRAI
jgi:hypothetical protein